MATRAHPKPETQLTRQLLDVVQESTQPEQTELWLVSIKNEEAR